VLAFAEFVKRRNFFSIFKSIFFLAFLFSAHALVADTVVLRDSFAGNINYVVTGGTMRTADDATNPCSMNNGTLSGTISGIPAGAVIEGAILYWAGSGTAHDYTVTFNGNSVTADRQFVEIFNSGGTDYEMFGGAKHVQAYITGNGTYTFTGLTVNTGAPWSGNSTCLGGWGLIVIYSHPTEVFRTVNIFDGLQNFRGNLITLTPKNFVAKSISGQVDGKFTVVTWEGDDGNSGAMNGYNEEIVLNSTTLTNAGNPLNNQFNSTINTINTNVDKYGVDIDTYNISGIISPGSTTANTHYSSGADRVLLMAEIITVSNDPVSDLSITKSHSGNFTVNTNGTYTLGVTNNGPSDHVGTITVTDTLPTGLGYVSATGTGWTCGFSAPTITCTRSGTLVDSASTPNITVTVAVANAAYPSVTNTATVTGTVFDNISANNTVTDPTTVLGPSFATSTKTVTDLNGGLALPGDVLRYTVTAINSTTIPATFASVSDDIPANVSNFTVVSTPVGSTNASTGAGTGANGNGYLNITNFTVAGSSSATVVFDVTINSVFNGTTIPNTATVDAPGGADATPSSATITVTGYNLTTSTKTVSDVNGNASYPGDTLRYTITAINSTAGAATGVIITDNIAANVSGLSVVSIPAGATDASTGNGTGTNGNGYLNVTGINIPGNSSVTVVFDVTIGMVAPGTLISNSATLDGPGGAAGDATKSSTNVTVTGFNLSTSTKSVTDQNGGESDVGDVLRYTITAINTSNSAAISTSITDNIPASVDTFTVVSTPAGSTNASTGTGTGTNGTGYLNITNVTVPANSSVTVVFDVTIAAGSTPGNTISNSAIVDTPSGTDGTPSSATITISPSLVATTGIKPLYMNVSADTLGRVAPTDSTTVDTIADGGTNTYLLPALSTNFTVSANGAGANITTVVMRLARNAGGTTRQVRVYLEYGSGATWTAIGTNPTTLTPTLNTTYSTITFSPAIAAPVTIPSGQQIRIRVNNNTGTAGRSVLVKSLDTAVTSEIKFYTSTVISVTDMKAYTAAYPAGALQSIPFAPGETAYLRSFVADPFGAADVTSATIDIKKPDGTAMITGGVMTNIPAGATASSKLFEYTYLVPNPTVGGFWTGRTTAIEGAENGTNGLNQITDSLLSTFIVGQAIPTLLKSSTVISDPINTAGGTQPKRIPGAVIEYSILATNTGRGPIDTGETVITDPLPTNMMMCVSVLCSASAGNPLQFTQGIPTSGLIFTYLTGVTYSSAVGGGAPFTYTPVPDVNGYDGAVTGIKIIPAGIFAASSGTPPHPSFTLKFRMKVR
jgi:uncharacterized repeat protein (TIGR01451 family)